MKGIFGKILIGTVIGSVVTGVVTTCVCKNGIKIKKTFSKDKKTSRKVSK